MSLKYLLCGMAFVACATIARAFNNVPESISASIFLKVPGNDAKRYPLTFQKSQNNNGTYYLENSEKMPLTVSQNIVDGDDGLRISVSITALEDIYFNYSQQVATDFRHNDCLFYMPGFWYRRNLRSPKEAPSFHTSDSWIVSEDRLSAPLTGIFCEKKQRFMTVNRLDKFVNSTLATHREGEIILSDKTSLGYTGFENKDGVATLSFGFPYREAPKSYIRKLTLAPAVTAYQHLKKGETILLTWQITEGEAKDYSDFVRHTWEYCYDTYLPKPVDTPYSIEYMKQTLSQFFVSSFVDKYPLVYNSGIHLRTDACTSNGQAEVGFIGRVLLNPVHSIRRQSEGLYAIFHFLAYEKEKGRKHPEWEQRLKNMLNMFLQLQNADGSFPRKFRDDFSIVDKSGGSTPSATLPLVMGYKYFKDKRYLDSAKRTADYLEKELISKADYFSSTLDANCEDKEASLYAATATYYLSLVTKGEEHKHYADLTKQAAYFALSWYYLWDVPFAPGQMLGDIGLKTRGWGNVSVENNHIDVFVFEFADVLRWLSNEYKESRFSNFAEVISTSMRQLLPYEGHMCGIAKVGYYPEVVQHTSWDYGKNGKGYYNDIFAPGWTVASLWELFTPGRAEIFMER